MEAAVIDKLAGWFEYFGEHARIETDGEAILVPPGTSLARTEVYAAAPRFHRHHYTTERLADFINYATRVAETPGVNEKATAYVLPDGSGAQAIFDHGDQDNPAWGHHRATLKLRPTPAWTTATQMARSTHPQQQIIDWLEDWSTHITAHDQDGVQIDNRRAISALRRVKLEAKAAATHAVGDMARQKTSMESIEASGDAEALPAYFVLNTPLYVGTVSHPVVLRLGVREGDGGKPMLALRIVGMEQLIEATSAWVEAHLIEKLGDKLAGVYVGAIEIAKP